MDCHIITQDNLQAGSIVEYVPVCLLEQDEDGVIDHKVLTAISGQHVETNQQLLEEMPKFTSSSFSTSPKQVTVGEILLRQEALRYNQEYPFSDIP